MRMRKKESGITLLEVLIAVLIVGIIATAAIPMLASYTEKAREAAQDALAASCNAAVDRYGVDHQYGAGYVVGHQFADAFEAQDYALRQLTEPTDGKGNVMGAPVTADPGPFAYGPYITDSTLKATQGASLLLAIRTGEPVAGKIGQAFDPWTIIPGDTTRVTYTLKRKQSMPGSTSQFIARQGIITSYTADEIAKLIDDMRLWEYTHTEVSKAWHEDPADVYLKLTCLVIPEEGTKFSEDAAQGFAAAAKGNAVVFLTGKGYMAEKPFDGHQQVVASLAGTKQLVGAFLNQGLERKNPMLFAEVNAAYIGGHDSTVAFMNRDASRLVAAYGEFTPADKQRVKSQVTANNALKGSISKKASQLEMNSVIYVSDTLNSLGRYRAQWQGWIGGGAVAGRRPSLTINKSFRASAHELTNLEKYAF